MANMWQPQNSELPRCAIINLQTSTTLELPCYPDDITMNINASWEGSQAIGRSEPVVAYGGTSFKEYNFTIGIHRDMCDAYGLDFDNIETACMNTVYAKYGVGNEYHSPLTAFTFGAFTIEGAVTSLNVKYTKPIDYLGRYMYSEISISIKSIPQNLPEYNNFNKDWGAS